MENAIIKKCSYWRCSLHLGLFFVLLFIICFLWYWVIQAESLRTLHLQLLQLSYIGYSGMNFVSFIVGAVQSFIWAYVVVGLWNLVACCWKSGGQK